MKYYRKIGRRLLPFFPSIEVRLKQANLIYSPEAYLGKCFITATKIGLLSFLVLYSINLLLKLPESFFNFIILIPIVLVAMFFFYGVLLPSFIVSKKVSNIDKNILFFLRHFLIEIKSGMSLYDCFYSIANSNHEVISEEFSEVVKAISMGIPDTEALEEMMIRNPSINFKRVIWQIINAIKSGADVNKIIEELVNEVSAEQKTKIRMYGSQLNSLALIYMMFSIIVPSIGITFLIILSFFSNFSVNTGILILLMIVVIVFQFMFLGIIKTKRPKIE